MGGACGGVGYGTGVMGVPMGVPREVTEEDLAIISPGSTDNW
jgi:hypothetical protein